MYEERRYLPGQSAIEDIAGRCKIVGYAAVFNSPSEEMPVRKYEPNGQKFREVIRPGAFAESLVGQRDIFANFMHDNLLILGSTQNRTLRLTEDNRGLRYEIDPPNTQAGRDAVELIRRRDVAFSSFGFMVRAGGDSWRRDGSTLVRELRTVTLIDISPVTRGAYPATDVALRSFEEWERSRGVMAMRLELAERVTV
jgi:HK97 family phage prohead protease